LKGFTSQEIADILQISLDSAKIRLHRARTKLRKELEDGCDFYLDEESELDEDLRAAKFVIEGGVMVHKSTVPLVRFEQKFEILVLHSGTCIARDTQQ